MRRLAWTLALVLLLSGGFFRVFFFSHPQKEARPGTQDPPPTESHRAPPLLSATSSRPITLLFVGDIMPARWVEKRMKEHGIDYPFEATQHEIAAADFAFANLESPLFPGEEVPGGSMTFRANPAFAEALARAGFDAVTIANNHGMDQGGAGARSTIRALDAAHIAHVGIATSTDAYGPLFFTVQGFRIAIVASTAPELVPARACATEDHIGLACRDERAIAIAIHTAREQADLVIFTMHDGIEYHTGHSPTQEAIAHAAIDAGADLVVGHHPHVIEDSEIYKGVPIFYSLGNFVFDQTKPETKRGATVTVLVDPTTKTIATTTLRFVRIKDYAQPTWESR